MPNVSTAFTQHEQHERVVGLFRLGWAVQTHFANFDLVPELEWERAVVEALPAVAAAGSLIDYYAVLQQLAARLRDGHTFVLPPPAIQDRLGRPAAEIGWIEEQPVVTWVGDGVGAGVADDAAGAGLHTGAVVLSVDGRPAAALLDQLLLNVSASTDHGRRALACSRLLLGPRDEPVHLVVDDGQRRHLSLARTQPAFASQPPLPVVECRSLNGEIAFIAINTFNDRAVVPAFDAALDAVDDARGLVLDLRSNGGGNGAYAREVAARLVDHPLRFERMRMRQTLSGFVASGWGPMMLEVEPDVQPPRPRPYLGPVAVLIGPLTASAAEDFLVGLDADHRVCLVGEPTAGSTGQPLRIPLPHGGTALVCTRRCLYPDGREYVGCGIPPGIVARQTIAGLRAGHDAVLDAAVIALMRGNLSRN